MASAKLNPVIEQLRGQIGGYVFRHVRGKLVVSRAPDFSRRKRTARQKASSATFGQVAARARAVLSDPKQKASYQAKADRLKLPLISIVMSDLMAKEKTQREV
jgi:hypothetical protein